MRVFFMGTSMQFLLTSALAFIIHWITSEEVTPSEISHIKRVVQELEHKAIDNAIKREEAAGLIKTNVGDVSDKTIDWLILTLRMMNNAGRV